jgi:hypothetical protein
MKTPPVRAGALDALIQYSGSVPECKSLRIVIRDHTINNRIPVH